MESNRIIRSVLCHVLLPKSIASLDQNRLVKQTFSKSFDPDLSFGEQKEFVVTIF